MKKKIFYLHPLLFAAHPIIFFYSLNIREIFINQFLVALVAAMRQKRELIFSLTLGGTASALITFPTLKQDSSSTLLFLPKTA